MDGGLAYPHFGCPALGDVRSMGTALSKFRILTVDATPTLYGVP